MSSSKKFKAKFIFYDKNICTMIKGYVVVINYDNTCRYYLYGINNMPNISKEIRDLLMNKGISSLTSLKELIPSFYKCIVESEASEYIEDEYVAFQCFADSGSLHITLDPWIIKEIKGIVEKRSKEHLEVIENMNSNDLLGVIQPSLSSVIAEMLLKYIVMEEKND